MNSNSSPAITINTWLTNTTNELRSAHIESARLDALLLLTDFLGRDKSWILAHPEETLTDQQIAALYKKIMQRKQGLPLAYIRGYVEFYGRNFTVNKHVLVPRPESESIIECIKNIPISTNTWLIDVGTGSGALAITTKLEVSELFVTAVDIDAACLTIASINAANLSANISVAQSDLLENIAPIGSSQSVIILANLPYVPTDYPISYAAKHEPERALFGGEDGLNLYRKLFAQSRNFLSPVKYIITESLLQQHRKLAQIAKVHDFHVVETRGLAQVYKKS